MPRYVFFLLLVTSCSGLRPLREQVSIQNGSVLPSAKATVLMNGSPSDFPLNVSGTYKGTWTLSGNSTTNYPVLNRPSGTVIFQLRSFPSNDEDIQYLEVDLALRNGKFIADGDVRFHLEGVYVRPYGKIRLISNGPHKIFEGLVQRNTANMSTEPELMADDIKEISSLDHQIGPKTQQADDPTFKTCPMKLVTQISKSSKIFSSPIPASSQAPPSPIPSLSFSLSGTFSPLLISPSPGSPPPSSPAPCMAPNAPPSFTLSATLVSLEPYFAKALNYAIVVHLISLLQIFLTVRQMEQSNTPSGASKISLFTVGHQTILDAYLCLIHLTAGILLDPLFSSFATCSFLQFLLFSLFEMRFMLFVWRSQRSASAANDWLTLRGEIARLYSRFYLFLFLGLFLLFHYSLLLPYPLLPFFCFWVPQIVVSAVKDSRNMLSPAYICGMSVTRLFPALYVWGCPKNFLRVATRWGFCVALVLVVAGLGAVVLLQSMWGGRFFVPKMFLPEKYSYFRRCPSPVNIGDHSDDEGGNSECVICMTSVTSSPRSKQRMVTPCDHVFHSGCLQRWMDVKMECPTCRRSLPPL